MTGGVVREAVLNFFQTGTVPSFLGETKLVLIPKTPNPPYASDFRTISCYNVIYKCIAKLLCVRLKEVLPDLINQNQGAFVKGRELLFNILMCQDIVRGYPKKGISPRCIMKIDLKKAFDSVHWGCLEDWLHHLKFPHQFASLSMACIKSVTYRVYSMAYKGKDLKGDEVSNREIPCLLCFFSSPWNTSLDS